uniref:ORF47i n=1 Tax=Pinus koraiensis TaxID=88728 RepID=Q85X02_PINKO|nr:ORF47i [Pinus koraiensis]AAO74065.1 ORF47i [Pinus koraiensis]
MIIDIISSYSSNSSSITGKRSDIYFLQLLFEPDDKNWHVRFFRGIDP